MTRVSRAGEPATTRTSGVGRTGLTMQSRGFVRWIAAAVPVLAFSAHALGGAYDEQEGKALLEALARAKVTLAAGIKQAAQSPAEAISAKFEMDERGQLSLSVYTAAKGLTADAEHNVLQELSGGPEGQAWKPEVETFKDVEHVARASEQLTLMQLTRVSLASIVSKAARGGGTVFSVTPLVRHGKPVFAVLVADRGRVRELSFDLVTGSEAKQPRHASAR